MIAAIDDFKYGNQKVKDISTYDQFKNAGSMVITESEINKRTTNSELSSYADSTFHHCSHHREQEPRVLRA